MSKSEKRIVLCPHCGTKMKEDKEIGYYCSNMSCKVNKVRSDATAVPVKCEDCGREISVCGTYWFCKDAKIRCDECMKKYPQVRMAG